MVEKAEQKNMNLSEIEEGLKNISAAEQSLESVKKAMDDELKQDLQNLQDEKDKMEAAYKRQQRQLEAQHTILAENIKRKHIFILTKHATGKKDSGK